MSAQNDVEAVATLRRRCSACRHPKAGAIDVALGTASKLGALAAQFGLSQSALDRHKRLHLRPTLLREIEGRALARDSEIQKQLYQQRERILARIATAGNATHRDFTLLEEQMRRNLELDAKYNGAFRDDAPRNDNRKIFIFQKYSEEKIEQMLEAISGGR